MLRWMTRMFGFVGNRADLGARVLQLHRDVLATSCAPGEQVGWGVGFYQSGEVLLRRRPLDERTKIDLVEAAGEVRTDVLLAHVRRASVGTLRTENTHPFRYRGWLFASTGTIGGFDALRPRLLASLPEFLRRNVRGDTDSECAFHVFLSFLHDAGHLGDEAAAPARVRDALRASIALVDRMSAEEGHGENTGDVMVASSEHLVAVHRAGGMAYRVLSARHDLEELLGADTLRQSRIPNLESARFALIAAELGDVSGFVPVPARSFATLTRSEAPEVEAL